MEEPILKKYMENAQAESNPTKPNTDDDINIELSKEFLNELKNNAHHGIFDEDVVDHIAKVLELLNLIKIPSVDSHRLRMKVFPLSLADDARQWWINEGEGKITTYYMINSEHSTVTYTSVSFPVEDDSDIGSPGVDGPPIMPEDPYAYIMAAYEVPPSPDYIPGPESPPPLDFVPEPMYPEYMPQEDEILPAEEQPLPAAALLTTLQIHQDMFLNERMRTSDEDEEEEEEHPALADSVPPVHRMTARISIRDEPSISLPPREEVERLLALTTPPPSPLTPLSSPLPQIPSPPLPIPSPPPNSPTHIEILESCLPLWKRARLLSHPNIAPGHPMSRELDYGITDTWDDLVGAIDEIAPTTLEGVNQWDRPVHRRLAVMIEREAKMAREAWGLSMDASDYACSDVMSLRTTVVAQSALISELQSADHRRQRVISELLASDHKRQVQLTKTLRLLKGLQTQMVEFQRQHGPAKGPAQPDAPGEAGSSS
ncbi:hypothetical protein Tco_0922220 [Tanacetum coccineum]|uniref:Uncharacterized protein n=1 Tax=Tanacetum coccineum TaxID=301880 RepID=A0ABQ5D0S1_9ASTR